MMPGWRGWSRCAASGNENKENGPAKSGWTVFLLFRALQSMQQTLQKALLEGLDALGRMGGVLAGLALGLLHHGILGAERRLASSREGSIHPVRTHDTGLYIILTEQINIVAQLPADVGVQNGAGDLYPALGIAG